MFHLLLLTAAAAAASTTTAVVPTKVTTVSTITAFFCLSTYLADGPHHPISSAVGERAHQLLSIAGTRGLGPADDPSVFNGSSLTFQSYRKERTMFAVCCAFGDVFKGNREVLIADPALSYNQINLCDCSDDEIERHRKAYPFLRSGLNSEVNRGIHSDASKFLH